MSTDIRQSIRDYSPEQFESLRLWYDFIEDTLPLVRNLEFREIPRDSSDFAVFLLNRRTPGASIVEYVLRNVMYFLGADWGLQIFGWPEDEAVIRQLTHGWREVHVSTIRTDRAVGYDGAFRTEVFWDEVRGDRQLFFDMNSLLCHGNVDDFVGYDYIAAPWHASDAVSSKCQFGNLGLSLCRRAAMLDVLKTCNRNPSLIPQASVYFSVNFHLYPDDYNLPALDVASRFAVEGVYHPRPFGLHKAWMCLPPQELRQLLDQISYVQESAGQ